ncbi:MAG TPA: arginase [Hyphomicrobiales bacterium]
MLAPYNQRKIALLGVPVECGGRESGPAMGPFALRRAGLGARLAALGYCVEDHGDLTPIFAPEAQSLHRNIRNLGESAGWTRRLMPAAEALLHDGVMPVWLGGDHSLSLGTVAGAAAYAKSVGRPLFVLWLDAHPDFNTFATTASGNTHGMSAAFFCGLPGFEALLGRPLEAPVDPANVCMIGIRSVDRPERELLRAHGVRAHAMAALRECGAERLLEPFLHAVAEANGLLHVSFDVDFLDPGIAPATGTPVPGGASLTEARRIMALVRESRLMASLDIAELNPSLDEGGRTAALTADLAAGLFGRAATAWRRPARGSPEIHHSPRS